MKKLFTMFTLALLAFIVKPDAALASHLAGADLTYEFTGNPNEYLIRLKLYRDCTGITLGTTADVCLASAFLSSFTTVTLNEVSVTVIESSDCVTAPSFSCPGGLGDVEEHIYEGIVTLAGQAADWKFSWSTCCRNGAITTLNGAAGLGLFVAAYLDNLNVAINSSPSFANLAYTRFCAGKIFYYDQGAVDPDGDSLVFSLVDAEEEGFFQCPSAENNCQYAVNALTGTLYSGLEPLSSSIPITIDPLTGVVNFVPNQIQVGVMCIRVEEFRNGVKIGQVKRDIQINIIPTCNIIVPSFITSISAGSGGFLTANCNDYKIIIPFDTTFQCASAVPTDFRTNNPYGIPNPVTAVSIINCQNGRTDSVELTFLNPLSVGTTRLWIKKGFDGNTLLSECGAEMPEALDTINIVVTDNSVWFPVTDSVGCLFNDFSVTVADSFYCFTVANDGSDFQLVDAAGTNFPIANAYGYCTPNGLKANELLIEMASPTTSPGPLYLLLNNSGGSDGNTLANSCGRFLTATDTLAILFVDNIIPVNLGSDQSLCEFQAPYIVSTGYPGINYQWSDQNGIIAGATFDTLAINATGTYIINLNTTPSCTGTDTVVVTFVPSPTDNLPADLSLCVNDTLPTLDAGNTGSTFQWFLNGTAISGATSQTFTPTSAGTYSVSVNNGNPNCIGNFDVAITTFPAFTVTTLSNQTICAGTPLPLLDAGNPGAPAYQWFLNGNPITGANSQTYQTTGPGTYVAEVGSGNCRGVGSMDLVVVDLPIVTLSNQTICENDLVNTLDAGNVGATYQWSENGVAISGATAQTFTPAGNVGSNSYSVDVTVNPGCTSTASMQLVVNPTPIFAISDTSICEDGNATLDPGLSGATVTYSWNSGETSQSITTNVEADYILTITQNGCVFRDTASVTVNEYPLAPTVACVTGAASSGFKYIYSWAAVTGAVSYEVSEDGGITWNPNNAPLGPETHGANISKPNFSVRAIGAGDCRIGAESLPTGCPVVIPNIFTPNGDNKNDVFLIDNIDQYPSNTVRIINRWGKEVYSVTGYDNASKRFLGTDLPDGVYFYVINLGDGTETRTGSITINR